MKLNDFLLFRLLSFRPKHSVVEKSMELIAESSGFHRSLHSGRYDKGGVEMTKVLS